MTPFRLSRLRRRLLNLPPVTEDGSYLQSAAKAAEQDVRSGAYDEFLFTDDKLAVMPFERTVDTQLALMSTRLEDRGRRSVLAERSELFGLQAELAKQEVLGDSLRQQLEERNERLQVQREILAGNELGHHGLKWRGVTPEYTGVLSSLARLSAPIIMYIVVAFVDMGIIYFSFTNLGFAGLEAVLFMLPALGIQVVVPHLIGVRLSYIRRKPAREAGERRWNWNANWIAFLVLAGVWGGFIYFMTWVRVQYFLRQLQNEGGDNITTGINTVLFFLNVFMLLGLGLWLIVVATWHNYHETQFLRLDLSRHRLVKRLARQAAKTAKLRKQIELSTEALDVVQRSYQDAVHAATDELADASKSIYRRTLINEIGKTEFTAAYMPTEEAVRQPNLTALPSVTATRLSDSRAAE